MICPKCGKENSEETKFCPECGSSSNSVVEPTVEKATIKDSIVGEKEQSEMTFYDHQKRAKKKKLKKVVIAVILIFFIISFFNWIKCEHEYYEATCELPQICMHCEKEKGEPLGHTWVEASCSAPKTCSRCEETVGDALEHTPGKWKKTTDMVDAVITSKQCCSECDEILDKKYETIKKLHNGSKFLITPNEFIERLEVQLEGMSNNTLSTASGSVDGSFVCGVLEYGEKVSAMMFLDGEDTAVVSEKDTTCFNGLIGTASGSDVSARVLVALVETCDPSLSFDEAKSIASKTMEKGMATKNGINYVCMFEGNETMIGVTLE
ncbi:MAG: zinc ribbon domain-containing protein [Clostridia bacterium]|nr:zinc ribbon domain-containing protein [Clostridia bacterium]